MKTNSDKSSVTFDVEIEQKLFNRHYNKVCQQYAKRLDIAGFRHNNVPREIVEERISADAISEEAINSLLPSLLRQIINDNGQDMKFVGRPEVSKTDKKDPIVLEVAMALLPTVELADYSSIKVEKNLDGETVQIDDDEVEAIVENLLKSQGKWESTNSPLEIGFLTTISAVGTVDGSVTIDLKKREILLTSESNWPMPGFHDRLLGLYRGAQKEFALTIPDGFSDTDKVGKTINFKVTIHSASAQKLPELNDEFVKSLRQPDIENLEGLRSTIASNLRQRKVGEHSKEQSESILEQFCELSNFTISEILISQEKQEQLLSQQEEVKKRGMDWDDYLKQTNRSEEQLDSELQESVLKGLKRRLVLQALIEKEKPEIKEAHVKMAVAEMQRDPRFRGIKNVAGLEKRIRAEMTEQKALESAKEAIEAQAEPSEPTEAD